MRPRAIRLGIGLAMAGLAALVGGGLLLGVRPPRVSDLWPADLSQPGGWLIDWQIAELGSDAALCRRVLAAPAIEARPVADATPKPGCSWSNAVEIATAGGARLTVNPTTCELAAALAFWMTHVVQPKAVEILGARVASVDHLGSFACRNIRGSPADADRPSEHASANALDVAGFRLADGRRIRVAADWGRSGPEARFLAAIHKDGCRYFRVAIGPDYNAAHKDHFHLDRGRWRACR